MTKNHKKDQENGYEKDHENNQEPQKGQRVITKITRNYKRDNE